MALVPVILGFPTSNRIPGAFGEVVFGTAGQSAASLPLLLLCVGLKLSAGTVTPDAQVQIIGSTTDADTYAGPGGEGATMLYDAIKVAGNAGVPILYASPTPANGATAATSFLTVAGTWTNAGQLAVRIGGVTVPLTVNATDTTAQVATNLAAAISGLNGGRLVCSATASGSVVTVSCRTAGVRGMQHVVFADTSQAPSGLTATWYTTAAVSTAVTSTAPSVVIPATPNGYYYKCTTSGTTSGSSPTWPTTIGTTVTDGSAVWTCWGTTVTSTNSVVGVTLGNATGTETYTALLSTIVNTQYNRIALAANDATSLAAWKSQVDLQAAAPTDILQHCIVGANGTLTAATAIGQTTLNDPRFQVVWGLNGETHPSRMAAATGAQRALSEQQDPCSAYNNFAMPTIAPASQSPDWPTLPTKISALNNSVTYLDTQRGDNFMRIGRSITSKSLTGGNPDYSTFDTSQASVPDFVLTDFRLYFTSYLGPQNPRVQDNPNTAAGEKRPPSGVLTPDIVVSTYTSKLVDYSKGVLAPSSNPQQQGTVPPIVDAPIAGDVAAVYDYTARRIIMTANVRVKANNAQIGISIRQAA